MEGDRGALVFQLYDLQGVVSHGHTARRPHVHVAPLDVGVEKDGVVVAVGQRESTRALAVRDVGTLWTHKEVFKRHGETLQSAGVPPRRTAGVCSGGPQPPLHAVRMGHSLQGLEKQERTVLALSCSEEKQDSVSDPLSLCQSWAPLKPVHTSP